MMDCVTVSPPKMVGRLRRRQTSREPTIIPSFERRRFSFQITTDVTPRASDSGIAITRHPVQSLVSLLVLEVSPPIMEVSPPIMEVSPPIMEVSPPIVEKTPFLIDFLVDRLSGGDR